MVAAMLRRSPLAARTPAALAALLLLSCSARPSIGPFYSDGCTLFPDGKVGDRRLWCDCCFAHDIAYWRGGTEAERKVADEALRACVLARTGDAALASLMYEGVRLGGSPVFLNWYRWAYGWTFGRGYQPLSGNEAAQANEQLDRYFRAHPGGYCARK
jgi:hypothetical protein